MGNIIVTIERWPVVKFVLSMVASFGGGAAVAGIVIRFFSKQIADRISKKYEVDLTKSIERYKSELLKEVEDYKAEVNKKYAAITTSLGKKQYISEKRFDAEFEIFQKLSLAYSEMVRDITLMNSAESSYYLMDRKDEIRPPKELYEVALRSYEKAQNTLFSVAPFIPKRFVDSLDVIEK